MGRFEFVWVWLLGFFFGQDYETKTGLEPHDKYKLVTSVSAVTNRGRISKEQTPCFLPI